MNVSNEAPVSSRRSTFSNHLLDLFALQVKVAVFMAFIAAGIRIVADINRLQVSGCLWHDDD